MIYQFREGFANRNVDAQTVGDELERIRKAHDGKLFTEDVVQWAAEPDSTIHGCFTWDDERAAHLHRMNEARSLIKSVVVVTDKPGPPRPAYWNIVVESAPDENQKKPQRYYQSSAEIAADSKEFIAAMNSVLSHLSSALFSLEQLWGIAPAGRKMAFKQIRGYVQGARDLLSNMLPDRHLS